MKIVAFFKKYFDILTISLISNLGSLLLVSLVESIYVFDFTSTGFILIVQWYVLFYLSNMSSHLSIYMFFEIEVMYL